MVAHSLKQHTCVYQFYQENSKNPNSSKITLASVVHVILCYSHELVKPLMFQM